METCDDFGNNDCTDHDQDSEDLDGNENEYERAGPSSSPSSSSSSSLSSLAAIRAPNITVTSGKASTVINRVSIVVDLIKNLISVSFFASSWQ